MGSESDEARVVSLGGSRIFTHGEPAPFQPVSAEMCLAQISAHIEQHLGPIDLVIHELISDTVHIDVHVIRPTLDYPWIRLATAPKAFESLVIDDEKTIVFYSVIPIYQAEMDLKLLKGSQELFKRLDAKGVAEVVDPCRVDVTRKRFVFF